MKTFRSVLWANAFAPVGHGRADAATPGMGAVLKNARFMSYTPRSFSVVNGQTKPASLEGITADLKLLRPDFDSLITYSCSNGLEHVPAAAEKLEYLAVIVGIWDPKSEIEIQNAIRLAKKHPKLIIAISIGNEGIYAKHYTPADVEKTLLRLRKELPSISLTTSEPFFLYLKPEYFDFFNKMDLLLPNIHPTFETWFQSIGCQKCRRLCPECGRQTAIPVSKAPYRQGNRASVRACFDRVYRSISKRVLDRNPEAVRAIRNQGRFLL